MEDRTIIKRGLGITQKVSKIALGYPSAMLAR